MDGIYIHASSLNLSKKVSLSEGRTRAKESFSFLRRAEREKIDNLSSPAIIVLSTVVTTNPPLNNVMSKSSINQS